jgi:hypothetical protein
LRRLPAALHDGLIIVTSSTGEIVVQSIVRAERDFLVIRGRMSGSQDTGRVVFIPFDQINYVVLGKKPADAELQGLLAKPVEGARADPASESAPVESASQESEAFIPTPPVATEPQVPPDEPAPPPRPGPVAGPGKPAPPSKTILLARLRARLAADAPPKATDK